MLLLPIALELLLLKGLNEIFKTSYFYNSLDPRSTLYYTSEQIWRHCKL